MTTAPAHIRSDVVAALTELAGDDLVRTLVLYGSMARGTERPGSDVDIILDLDGSFRERSVIRGQLMERLPYPIGNTTSDELATAPEVLINIFPDAWVVCDRDGRYAALLADRDRIVEQARQVVAGFADRTAAALAALAVKPSGR